MHDENTKSKVAFIFAFTPLHFRRPSPRAFDFSPLHRRSGLTLATSFLYASLTMTHLSNTAEAHLPERRRTLLGARARGRLISAVEDADVSAVSLYRCCGAIRKDDLALIAPFNVERQLNLARRRRQRDTCVYCAFRVIKSHERNGSALLRRQCDESINTYELMMR